MKIKLWENLAPHIKVEKYVREGGGSRNPRFRLELKRNTPDEIMKQAVRVTAKCASCGKKIYPVRLRTRGIAYIAVTCPLTVNVACSRNPAASLEYKRIAGIVRGM
jgi:hypothetical protein